MIAIMSSRRAYAAALAQHLEPAFGAVRVSVPGAPLDEGSDVVVVDCVQHPGAFGLVRRLAFSENAPWVVVLVSRPSDFVAQEARQAGARAVLSDLDGLQEWTEILQRLDVHRFQLAPSFAATDGIPVLRLLTRRQAEVFRCIFRGFTDEEIARELGISLSTAETHRYELMRKLGVTRHDRLPLLGVQLGMIDASEIPPPPALRQATRSRCAASA